MSELTKLLEGVEIKWKTIDDYINYIQRTKYLVKSKNYSNEYTTPVLTAGKTFVLGYTNEIDGIYKASITPVIIFDDFTTANKWVDFDFKAKSSAMKLLVAKDFNKISLKYFFYILKTIPSDLVDGDHKRQWISNYANKLIPIPCPDNPEKSLKIQQEIVRILDSLSEETNQLTAALQKELVLHQKQYNFYREELFKLEGKEVEWKSLGEISSIGDGLHGTPKYNDLGNYYFINGNNLSLGKIEIYSKTKKVDEITFQKYGMAFNTKKTIFLSINGTIGSVAFYNNENILLGKSVAYFNITDNLISVKYLYYLFHTSFSRDYFEKNKTGSTIKNLGLKALRQFFIPIPSLPEQERIVKILDDLDEKTQAITTAIKKEIALRNKQYEYYRDHLLSFHSLQTEAEAIH